MSQITLVTDKHNNDVGVGMVAQFLKPPGDILVGLMLANVVDEKGTNGAAVVGRCDGAVALLAGCIPNLGLDGLGVDLNRSGSKLNADSGLGIEVEFVSGESAQQVGFADAGVSDEDDCQVVSTATARRRGRSASEGCPAQQLMFRNNSNIVPLKRNCNQR